MKKSLLAVAAMTAFAGAAQAQSSVTIYGILDVGYIGSNVRAANNAATSSFTPSNNAGGVVKMNNSAFGDSAESTSRLGFKGNEDLGGGMSAFFTIETAVSPNSNTGVFSASGSGNRQTFVGLGKKGIGKGAIGTQYTTIHTAVSATDPGQTNNMMGNVIYDKWAGYSSAQGGSSYGSSPYAGYAGDQNNTSYTVRQNNMLRFDGDTFAGFTPKAFLTMNNSTSTQGQTVTNTATTQTIVNTGGVNNQTGWGLGLDYSWKKLLVTANYQSFKGQTTAGTYASSRTTGALTTSPDASLGGYGGANSVTTNATDVQQYYAGTYDFGILKAYVQYVNRKATDINNANDYLTRTAQQIGVRSFITPTVEAWVSGGTGRLNTNGSGGYTANFNGWQLGSNYWLSKRTNLYAIYGQQATSNANRNMNVSVSTNPTSYNANNYAIGVRHTF
jgi:predicted porin